jgi:SAM-dependent methyltransferase
MDAFAENYDLMVGADYDKISKFIFDVSKKYKPDSELVCDLGCGTASVTTRLSELGFDMIGIDSNEDMLVFARENISKSGQNNILLLNQDITDFELYGTVDVIYSTLDTLNYITDKRSLTRLFKLVKNYLNYDGLFIFDINSEYKFKEILASNDFIYEFDDLFCCWSVDYNEKSSDCYHHLTYFEKTDDGNYSKKISEQFQRFYPIEYINQLCHKFGFEILMVCDDYSTQGLIATTERITYVLKINK